MTKLTWIVVTLGMWIAEPTATLVTSDPVDDDRPSAVGLMRATQESFREVARSMRPYLVRIETVGGSQPRGSIPPRGGRGSPAPNPFQDTAGPRFEIADGPTTGIVYSSDGYIITSSFNFVRAPILISVVLADGRRLVAELVARDQVRKLALLKIDADDLPVPRWRSAREIHIGQWAIALGLGFGGHEPAIATGIISALDRMHENAIQTDAKLNPANYGGPICDLHGYILGIGVPMAQRPGELAGIEMYDSGVGFALKHQRVEEIVAILKTGESIYRGWLGFQLDGKKRGKVVIGKMAIPSPIRAAGAQTGDHIVMAAGREVHHFGDLVQALYMIPAGESVDLRMRRGSKTYDITVVLARNIDLGPLPASEEVFDPSAPLPTQTEDE